MVPTMLIILIGCLALRPVIERGEDE